MFKPLSVTNDVYWVGALDKDLRVFDIVMTTEYGTSYNSYIVKGSEKTAVIETAKDKFFDEFIERVKDVCDPTKLDYLIVNHTEPDHSGSVEKFLELNPDITVVGSVSAIKFLGEITNKKFNSLVVKEGDSLDLGGKTLSFVSAPFLHWPDSMYTYLVEEKTLFTCDSFGCHYADDRVFNDEIDSDFTDAYKYYFDCIMGPFKEHVLKALDKVEKMDISIVCPGHGPVLRKDLQKYFDLYRAWSQPVKGEGVVVAYASAYGYTKAIANAISEGINTSGVKAELVNLEDVTTADVLAKVGKAKGLVLGSPTIVNDMVPPVAAVLSGLNPTINKGLVAGAFGSYGWSGEAANNIQARFEQLKFKTPVPALRIMFKPSEEQYAQAVQFGKDFAAAL
jgi:flavorubredoxin